MVLKFGLQSIKILALILTSLFLISGVLLVARGCMCMSVWDANASQFVPAFKQGCSVALYVGIIIIISSIIGFISICASKYKMMIVFDVLIVLLAFVLLVYGLILWVDVKSEHSKILIKLRATINGLSPEALDGIQSNFKCCGIEKYTDYIMLGHLWNTTGTNFTRSVRRHEVFLVKNESKATPRPESVVIMTEPTEFNSQLQSYRNRKSWKHLPFSINSKGELEIPQDQDEVAENEPTRVWKAVRPSRAPANANPGALRKAEYRTDYRTDQHKPEFRFLGSSLWKRWFSTISDWFKGVWVGLEGPLLNLGKKLSKAAEDIYDFIMPDFIQQWISLLIRYVYDWWLWFTTPVRSVLRWWFGSGWDYTMFSHMGAEKFMPLSCCKNPSFKCHGTPADTYMEGCKNKVIWYWKLSNLELALLMLCYFPLYVMTAHTVYILIGGLRQRYLF